MSAPPWHTGKRLLPPRSPGLVFARWPRWSSPYTCAPERAPPSLPLGVVRRQARTVSVVEVTLWDLPACWRELPPPGLTPLTRGASGSRQVLVECSSYSENHSLHSLEEAGHTKQRESDKGRPNRKEISVHGLTDWPASETGYLFSIPCPMDRATHTSAEEIEAQPRAFVPDRSSGQINANWKLWELFSFNY